MKKEKAHHFKLRLWERYGLTISNLGVDELIDKINYGDAYKVETKDGTTGVYYVDHKRHVIKVVKKFDERNRNHIVLTCLPLSEVDRFYIKEKIDERFLNIDYDN